MPKRGENIYKRKDNRWEARYIKGHTPDGKPQFGYVYAHTYREVREKVALAKQSQPQNTVQSKQLFHDYCKEWLILSRTRVKESTYVKYHTIITHHIIPVFGNMLPAALTTAGIEAFSSRLIGSGFSVKTVRDILTVLRSVLKYCKRLLGAACPEVEIVYPKEFRREIRVLSQEEQNRFIGFLLKESDYVKFGVLLALLTGMRIGEVCALRWCDISPEENAIYIHSTMQRLQVLDPGAAVKTKVMIGETKTETSRRVIPLTDYAASLCQKMRPDDPNAYILTGDAVRFMEPRVLQYRLAAYTKACGLDGVHFHVLRHTFATRCVEVGFEIKSLSEILGHASAEVTLNRYVHASLALKRSNMQKLAAIGF